MGTTCPATPDTEAIAIPDPLVAAPVPSGSAGQPDAPLTASPLGVRGVFAYAVFVLAVIAITRRFIPALHGRPLDLAIVSAGAYLLILVPVFVLARRRHVRLSEFVGLRGVSPLAIIGTVAGVIGFAFAAEIAYGIVAQIVHIKIVGNVAQITGGYGSSAFGIASAFLLASIVAPFVEEVALRGVVFAGLSDRWGKWWAILASGLIFGIMHLQPTLVVPIALIGMALAWFYSLTRSLWASIAAHAVFNTVVLVLVYAVVPLLTKVR